MTWLMEILRIYQKTAFDRVLRDKALIFAKNTKYKGYQRGLARINSDAVSENKVSKSTRHLTEELHKSIIGKFQKRKYNHFLKIICGNADLAHMQLISKFNKEFLFLLCVIDIYSKYSWFVPLKVKKRIVITNAFLKAFTESNGKPNMGR